MVLLSRWPDRTRLLEGSDLASVWQRWLTALWQAMVTLQTGTQVGAGSPEGVITAPQGSLYRRTDGAAGTSLYVKAAGGIDPATLTNTGWVPLT
jgi:hypothetical protein